MERLTQRTDGVVVYVGAHNEEAGGQIPCEVGPQGVREILARLAEYEDAGLTPAACEQARKIEEGLNAYGYSVARMVELMIADKEGRVVVHARWADRVVGPYEGEPGDIVGAGDPARPTEREGQASKTERS